MLAWAAATWAPGSSVRPAPTLLEEAAPYVAVLAAVVTAGVLQVTPQDDPTGCVLGVAALVVTVLRQAAVLRENAVLRGGLEHLVAARTRELEASREELEHLAYHDPLTGLVNRTLLHDRLRQALTRLSRTGGATAVLLLDLDDFKTDQRHAGPQHRRRAARRGRRAAGRPRARPGHPGPAGRRRVRGRRRTASTSWSR